MIILTTNRLLYGSKRAS